MVDASLEYLAHKRFDISQDSMQLMRSVSSELQQDESFKVKGVAFWGSRTKGLAKVTSDLDTAVFYDGSQYPTDYYVYQPEEKLESALREGVKAKSDHIKAIRQKAASLVAGKVPTMESTEHLMDSICPVDISFKNLDYLLDTYRHDTQTDIGSVQRFELVSLFFLGIGDGLYQARSYVLDKLGNDDVLFARIMNDLSSLERPQFNQGKTFFPAPRSKRNEPPIYPMYPQTIAAAREYFLNKPIKDLPQVK